MTQFLHQLIYNWTHYNAFWADLAEVLGPGHVVGELCFFIAFDIVAGVLFWPRIKRMIQRHDKEHHGHDCEETHDRNSSAPTAASEAAKRHTGTETSTG